MKQIGPTTFVAAALLIAGCQQATSQNAELEEMRQELLQTQEKFERATQKSGQSPAPSDSKRQLVHLVWFDMKADADHRAFFVELRKLEAIQQVNGLEIGKFQELGDQRAMSELELVMRMSFDSEEDYRTYQDHPVHQQLKQDIGLYLDGPPVTYDYWTE